MQSYFEEMADHIQTLLKGNEVYTASFQAEESDFVRLNQNRVRQAGSVTQRGLAVDLIDGQRHVGGSATLSGDTAVDRARLAALVASLRDKLPHVPDDPYLLYATEVKSSEMQRENRLPPQSEPVSAILDAGSGKDLVGIYGAGGIHSGFANSFGQRNWFSTHSFNFDWCLYHHQDKAVKSAYAGFEWSADEFGAKMDAASEQLGVLTRTARTIDPGTYRVFLTPAALNELLGVLSWGGFGLKDHRTKQTSLLKMVEEERCLHPAVSITENTEEGVAPNFQGAGFIRPARVPLIRRGCFGDCLVSPRSAKEYGVPTNGASGFEAPESIDVAPGELPRSEVLARLDTGLYINNLWYLNYSDRPACRITGMTRFATFWVENGKVTAPVNVMRFDETVYRVLGEKLIDLTVERDFILDNQTYEQRSTDSARLPGVLVDEFTLTL